MISQITRQNTNENQSMVYQAFLVFYNNTQYQRRSAVLKKKILEGDLHTISIVIKVIKSILTYKTPITIERLIEKETAKEFQQIAKRYKNLLYNEFSKLLTLRFLREVYFQFSYAFMTCSHLQLNVILLKIAMFRHQSSDQERGKQMFYKQSKLFDCFQGCKQEKQPQHSKQIQTIGFSIHKMTLQILHTCGKLSKYLPYHQSFIEEEQEQIKQDKFQNAFYNTFIKVRQSAVKFPSKFHYFKESDLSKFRNIYDKYRKKDQSFRKLYTQIFSELWNLINHKIDNLKQQNVGLSQFLLMNSQQYGNLQQKIMYCQNLVLKTYDRYFWIFFHDFIGNKLNQLKNTLQFSESLTQTQLKYILSIFYFFIIWSHKLMQPQILYVIQHQYFHQLCKFFLIVLKFYARWSDEKQKKALKLLKKSKTPSRPLQSKLTSLQVLLEMKSCFRYIRQLGLDFSHHFTQKKNLAHSYPLISQLSDQILTIKLADQQGKINPDNESKLNSQISKRMSINHQYFFNKQEFIFLYHEKKAHNNYNFKQIKESLIKQAQSIFQKYKNHLKLGNYQPIQPITQYVTLDKQQEQLTIPQEDTLSTKIASIKRLSYKLNIGHHRSYSEDKPKIYEKLPPLKSSLRNSNASEPSFIDSLKIGVNKPNEDLLKIITSSRGLKRGGSSLQNSSVKSQMSHQNSEISHAVSISISDKDCSKTNLVSSFQQLKSFREVCLQDTNHIPSQKLAERFINPIKRNFKKSSRGTTPSKQANYNYITNHNESNIKELEISSEDQSNRKSYIEELKSQLKVTSNSKFVNNTLTTDLFPVKISEDLLIRDNNRNSDKDDVSLKVSRQHSSRITIKQSDSQSLLHFLYTPKAKRELLKKKTLVKKTQYIEVGLITNLQQQIIANQKETVKKETLCIKVYITALVPLSKVLVNIKFPNWLQCLSKGNLSKEDMNQQSQFISTFLVQLKLKKQKIAKRNYGQLPTLNIVYYDRHQKKDIISEPLFILINKFAIQKSSNQNEISQSFRLNLQSFIQIEVHDKIASDIKGLKSYFANITFMHLDPEEMMSSFASIDNLKDEIAVVKYQFIRPNQEIFLIFAEKQQRITFKLNHQKRKLSAWIVPKKSQAWNYQQLHIFQNCFRSILTAN